jgi:hypothetical protein
MIRLLSPWSLTDAIRPTAQGGDTMDEQTLIADAAEVIGRGEEILAAGIFGLQDDYAKLAVAGVATGAATAALDVTNPVAGGVAFGVATHETRRLNAEGAGLTVRMLVAVTANAIHILDRTELGASTRELLRFDRASTAVQVTKFGLSRHLNLADEQAGTSIGLVGSAAFYVPETAGDKLVLHLLSAQG